MIAPMRRGLKQIFSRTGGIQKICSVRMITPMRRGLKHSIVIECNQSGQGQNDFPDEKGIETLSVPLKPDELNVVRMISPMRRGLKLSAGCGSRDPFDLSE